VALTHNECGQSRKKRADTDIGSDIMRGHVNIAVKCAFGLTDSTLAKMPPAAKMTPCPPNYAAHL
jgi:hypothetical protein